MVAQLKKVRNYRNIVDLGSKEDYLSDYIKREEEAEKFMARATKLLMSSLNYGLTLKKLAQLLVPRLADFSVVNIINDKGKLEQIAVAHTDPKKVAWALSLQKKLAKYTTEDQRKKDLERLMVGKAQLYPAITKELLDKSIKSPEQRKLVDMLDLKSVITVPITSGKKVLGSVSLVSTGNGHQYDDKDLKIAQEIGRRAGQAIENASLYYAAQKEIKKRKKIEEELRRSREQLSVILENVADGISVFDENAKVVFVNHAIALASGYRTTKGMLHEPEKWQNIFEVTNEAGEQLAINELPGRRAVLTKSYVEETLKSFNKKTGDTKWSINRARPIFDNKGNLKGAVSITHDITQRKELERKKDDFISIASHELKTPITSIKGFVHILSKRLEENDKPSYDLLSRVDFQLDKLTDLIEELLEMSRSRHGKLVYKKKTFDFSTLVNEVVDDMQQTNEKYKIILVNGIKQKIRGDRERLSQVLVNLINNAIKYSPDSEKIIVRVKKNEGSLQVGIRDFGIGIDRRERERIFDRFYRVESPEHKTFPGLGVGLYLSREIIERHKGKIWFESKRGKGSTFYFEIPFKVN